MGKVLYVDLSGAVHASPPSSAPADSQVSKQLEELIKLAAATNISEQAPSQGRNSHPAADPNVPFNGTDPWHASNDAGNDQLATQIVNQSRLACPRLTTLSNSQDVQTVGLLALPDSAICMIVQHVTQTSLLQLASTCKAMAQAVATRQQKQSTLVVQDKGVNWDALLTILSWMPVTAWHLDRTHEVQLYHGMKFKTIRSGQLLDRILGMTEESILTSKCAALSGDLNGWPMLELWNAQFSGGTWKPLLQYPSVVNVTLEGMELAFYVPPGLAIACPNIKQLTLKTCAVGKALGVQCLAGSVTRYGKQNDFVTRIVLETACSSLIELNLEDTKFGNDLPEADDVVPECISRNLPSLKKLSMMFSSVPNTHLLAFSKTVVDLKLGSAPNNMPMAYERGQKLELSVLAAFQLLHTLCLPNTNMTGREFTELTCMPRLRTLAVYSFRFARDDDFRNYNTHVQNLHIHSNTMEVTTLGRLPLQTLKNDPISGRSCLTVLLPFPGSTTEITRAINNLKTCCPFPVSVDTLCLEAHNTDTSDEQMHAAMLLQLLTTFKIKAGLGLNHILLGSNVLNVLKQLQTGEASSLMLNLCQMRTECISFVHGMLLYLPNLTAITVTNNRHGDWIGEKGIEMIRSACHAWASVQHQQPLSVTVSPMDAYSNRKDVKKLEDILRGAIPQSASLSLKSHTVCIHETVPGTVIPPWHTVPAVVASIEAAASNVERR